MTGLRPRDRGARADFFGLTDLFTEMFCLRSQGSPVLRCLGLNGNWVGLTTGIVKPLIYGLSQIVDDKTEAREKNTQSPDRMVSGKSVPLPQHTRNKYAVQLN